MKQLLLLLCIIAPMGLMAQNENLAQDTTLYLNGRKIVIKEQNDQIKGETLRKHFRKRYHRQHKNL